MSPQPFFLGAWPICAGSAYRSVVRGERAMALGCGCTEDRRSRSTAASADRSSSLRRLHATTSPRVAGPGHAARPSRSARARSSVHGATAGAGDLVAVQRRRELPTCAGTRRACPDRAVREALAARASAGPVAPARASLMIPGPSGALCSCSSSRTHEQRHAHRQRAGAPLRARLRPPPAVGRVSLARRCRTPRPAQRCSDNSACATDPPKARRNRRAVSVLAKHPGKGRIGDRPGGQAVGEIEVAPAVLCARRTDARRPLCARCGAGGNHFTLAWGCGGSVRPVRGAGWST